MTVEASNAQARARAGHEPWSALAAYYRSEAVRQRLAEYGCGRPPGEPPTFGALEIGGYGGPRRWRQRGGGPVRFRLAYVPSVLRQGADLYRSLADGSGTLLVLRIEYLHRAGLAEVFQHPGLCFERLEVVHQAVRQVFSRYDLVPLALMSARGYDYVLHLPASGLLYRFLVRLGSREETLPAGYYRLTALGRLVVEMECAHRGAGRLLEFLTHDVIRAASGRSAVPLALADLEPRAGASVRLDLSPYGDPLMARYLRCPFSSDQEALVTGTAPEAPFVINLPRGGEALPDLLAGRGDLRRAEALARSLSARIPTVLDAPRLVADYEQSALGRFHAELDKELQSPGDAAAGMEDLDLPPCVAVPLAHPDLLREARHLRTVSLGLRSLGLSPGAIIRLVRARTDDGREWADLRGRRADPAGRAEFYVGLFCGAAMAGLEDGAFECRLQRQEGLCPGSDCGQDLGELFARMRQETGS